MEVLNTGFLARVERVPRRTRPCSSPRNEKSVAVLFHAISYLRCRYNGAATRTKEDGANTRPGASE